MSRSPIFAHHPIALLRCDSAASLLEVLTLVELEDIPHQRFGDRALALPAKYAHVIRDALRKAGAFPRIVGEVPRVDVEEPS